MKHMKTITSRPVHASVDPTIGQILTVVASILAIVAQALVAKDSAS